MAAAIVAVAGLASVAATTRRLPVVDAREFRVLDAGGKVRATLGPSEARYGGIDDGQSATPTTALRIYDDTLSPRVILASAWEETGRSAQAGGSLVLSGRQDGPIMSVEANGEEAVVVLQGAEGNRVLLGGADTHGLTVRNGLREGNLISVGGGAGFEASDGKMTFYDSAGRAIGSVPGVR